MTANGRDFVTAPGGSMPSVLCRRLVHARNLTLQERSGYPDMRATVLFLAVVVLATVTLAGAQSATAGSNSDRKVVSRVAPVYPELARKMHIQGIVKVEAIVRANGSVKSTRVLGGNPVLVDAAQDAVAKWKFEAAQGETTEVVQVSFEQR
jgi:TonB family protein